MIKLNLLPPQEKEVLALEKIQRWIIFYGSAVFGILFIFIALLGSVWLYINIQLGSASSSLESAQGSFKGQDLKTLQKAINDLNNYLGKIDATQKTQKSYSSLLINLAQMLPDGARLDTLSIDDKNEVVINGYAQRRELVISLKDSLEKSALFSDVESPLSNLVKETNINFYFKFKLRPNVLIK